MKPILLFILSGAAMFPNLSKAQVDSVDLQKCHVSLWKLGNKIPLGFVNKSSDTILPLKEGNGVVIFSGALAYNCVSYDHPTAKKFKLGVRNHPETFLESIPNRKMMKEATPEQILAARDFTAFDDPRGYVQLHCNKSKTNQSEALQYLLDTTRTELEKLKEVSAPNAKVAAALEDCMLYEVQDLRLDLDYKFRMPAKHDDSGGGTKK